MKEIKFYLTIIIVGLLAFVSCDDFITKSPLDVPSETIFWQSAEQAEMWVNDLYRGLDNHSHHAGYEAFSDNAWGRAAFTNIANGDFEPSSSIIENNWSYRIIRLSHEFFENIDRVPEIPQNRLNELSGQVRFMLAFQYHKLTTLYRDVPLVIDVLSIEESDVGKEQKEVVVEYILDQLDQAINELPESWPASETGRITRGAALALKARVLLYNERWDEAAQAAQQIIDSNQYALHPNFEELFSGEFDNETDEVILARQYEQDIQEHDMIGPVTSLVRYYAPLSFGGWALVLPTSELQEAFEMEDGLPIDESPLYDPAHPFDNRDPRFYHTLLWHGQELNGQTLDLTGQDFSFLIPYLGFRKYLQDLRDLNWRSHNNWILFRYADVLLMYAEAKNEATGPEESIYNALNLIRDRAGMPAVNRVRYSNQASLREFIRNERRVELAGEGLRYFDIIRWRIAEDVLNIQVMSMNLDEWENAPLDDNDNPVLVERPVETRVFDPAKHYVWPIPQNAIDQSTVLEQHPEW